MTAFDDALGALHADPDFAEAATYRVGGTGDPVALRVIRSAPETEQAAFSARIIAADAVLHIRVADLPDRPAKGDTVTIGATIFTVRAGELDAERITWRVSYDGG